MVYIKVAVRIRPFSKRETSQKDESIVETCDRTVSVTNIKVPEVPNGDSRQRIRRFAVDFCYDPKYPETCNQESVYQDVGKEVLDSIFQGYNTCVLAYGHSASGKTYTMMGEESDPGLTPRICQGLFQRMDEKSGAKRIRFHTVISFLEIYNERVRDLLVNDESGATAGSNFSLRVREHPKLGPYVQGLSQHVVDDEERILEYLALGNSRRSTAATENNIHSSRSHAVFTIRVNQTEEVNYHSQLSSKVHLVDLAGSLQDSTQAQKKKNERAGSAQSKTRLKEGANINKSLVTLGNVISALAESCETFVNPKDQPSTKTWQPFVPYRDSVLTWLLKDTLGGNSNTIMIATISPASSCLNETINTLRYAKRTKRIVNQPIINEDPKIRTIKELKEEIEKLRNVIFNLQSNHNVCLEEELLGLTKDKNEGIAGANVTEGFEKEELENGRDDKKSVDFSPFEDSTHVGAPNVGKNVENNDIANNRTGIKTASANSFSDASKINDENKTDVNGSVIDKLVRETQVFPESLNNFSRSENHRGFCICSRRETCDVSGSAKKRRQKNPRDTTHHSLHKISRASKVRKQSRRRLKLNLRREYNSLENLTFPKMLHRSRPDLIKGIASHSKDGLPSTSSQSFTDVSGLSQSASENSLNSSGSVESQASENKSMKNWPDKMKSVSDSKRGFDQVKSGEVIRKSNSRQSSIGDGSGSSTPTQIPKPVPKRRGDRRSEIVAAVTTRLYATKKKPDPRMEAIQAAAEEEEDDDGELEELKLCKRARMKLFDLSRKLAMAKRMKKTMDSDTQTDFASATVRMKEKSVVTDQSGVVQQQSSGTNTPVERFLKKDKEQPIIMNQVFIPRFSNYIVECGRNVRVEVPGAKSVKSDSGTQTFTLCKDQTTSPPARSPKEENFSDDSLEDESIRWKKDCESDSLELRTGPKTNKSSVKSHSNENISKPNFPNPVEPIIFDYRRSYDSLIETGSDKAVDRGWLPITRYPIAGTNSLYEYDPNRSNTGLLCDNGRDDSVKKLKPEEAKNNRTEIVFPLYNSLPLEICSEAASVGENLTEDALNFLSGASDGSNIINPPFQNEENPSSENSFASNDGSDVTSSSETSSEDFIFYEGPVEKEPLNRQSGLGNLYTISENSELSDFTASDPSSPHTSLQVLEKEAKIVSPFGNSSRGESSGAKEDGKIQDSANRDRSIGVHILRNPLTSNPEIRERIDKSGCSVKGSADRAKYSPTECSHSEKVAKNDGLNHGSESGNGNDKISFREVMQESKAPPGENAQGPVTKNPGDASAKDSDVKKQQKKAQVKKMNWSDVQVSSQRQFLNFNILGSSKQMPFTIDSNMFGEKKEVSEGKFPSEDSITFVFMGPNRQKTSVLMEIIKRTLTRGSSSEGSFGEKSQKRSRNRGIQCKLMRSVSVDTAMIALSRFAKHHRPLVDIARTSSLDTLVPEEMQTILDQGRLHGIREKACQCDLIKNTMECLCPKSNVIKYTSSTSTTRDQGTETEKPLLVTEKSSMTSPLVDATCDASEENLFEQYFPPLPRRSLSESENEGNSHWNEMKNVILGTAEYLENSNGEKLNAKPRKSNKSVSWSDFSDSEELQGGKSDENMSCFRETEFESSEIDKRQPITNQNHDYIELSNCVRQSPDYSTNTRRVRFSEPQRSCMDDICNLLQEKKEATQTATNVTAFLKEAVQLLKNLNRLSQIYDVTNFETDEMSRQKVKSSLKKVETSVQTEASTEGVEDVPLSSEILPIRRAKTSSSLIERKERKGNLNLTWPRQRPNSNSSSNVMGKPPTGLKYNPSSKMSRSSLFRTPSAHSSYDVIKNDMESSSTSTNWNISNLSTTFSNSYFGDSGCSRPSSSKSFYSERGDKSNEGINKYFNRSNPKILGSRVQRFKNDLEIDLEDSCRRLEIAVERDRLREEISSLKLSSLNTEKYSPTSNYLNSNFKTTFRPDSPVKKEENSIKFFGRTKENSTFSPEKISDRNFGCCRKKPCKCFCHYRNSKIYRSSLELDARPPFERHCHVCCTPCEAGGLEKSSSAPALNSICEDNKCRLFYYGYCPCSPIKLQHVKTSPRAYMQHLLSLRRQIVKNTYDSINNT